ncbi:MAG: FAD-binding oxidoreductase [Pseudomonadota bacterium]
MERRTTHAALRRDLQRVLPHHRIQGTRDRGRGIIVRPEKPGELQQIIRIAWDAEVPVLPMGLSHKAVQLEELHLRLDLEGLSRILEYDASSGLVTVQSGVTLKGLADWLSSKKKIFPVHCMGNDGIQLWEFLSQPWAGGYGPATGHKLDQVVALSALLPDGEEITSTISPRRAVGPDPSRLLLSGEGRFALLTRATLRVVDAPVRVARLVFGGPHMARHLDTFWALSEATRPTEIRIMGRRRSLTEGEEGPWYTVLWNLWGEGRDLVRRKELVIKAMTPAFSALHLRNPYELEGTCPLAGAEGVYAEYTAQRRDLPTFCRRLSDALAGGQIEAFRIFGFLNGAVSVGARCGPGDAGGALPSWVDGLAEGLRGVHPGVGPPGTRELQDALAEALDPRGTFSLVHRLWSGVVGAGARGTE